MNGPIADLGTSIDLKSADKELKAVTPEKSKACVTAFTKKSWQQPSKHKKSKVFTLLLFVILEIPHI